jgi:RNA-directed DNA polymerase
LDQKVIWGWFLVPINIWKKILDIKLNISSRSSLEKALGLSTDSLVDLANKSNENYYQFAKRKKSGKLRIIDAPTGRLKIIQRKINKLLNKIPIINSVHGWQKGKSRITAALLHINQSHVYCFDIRDFYPSISNTKVFRFFCKDLNCSPTVAHLLTKLCTHKFQLPQGGACSPSIANLMLRDFDFSMTHYAKRHTAVYTRFGDDIIISSSLPLPSIEHVMEITLKKHGFYFNPEKTVINISTTEGKIEILGLIIGKTLLPLESEIKYISEYLRNLEQNSENLSPRDDHIYGKIVQIKAINPEVGLLFVNQSRKPP